MSSYCGECGKYIPDKTTGDDLGLGVDLCNACYEEYKTVAKKKSKTTKPKQTKVVTTTEPVKKAEAPRLLPVYASPMSDRILGWRMMNTDGQELFTSWIGDERPEGWQESPEAKTERERLKEHLKARTEESIKMIDSAVPPKDLGPATDLENDPFEGKFLVEILKRFDNGGTGSMRCTSPEIWHCDMVNLTEQEAKERMFQLKETLKLDDGRIRYVPMRERYRQSKVRDLMQPRKPSETVPIDEHSGSKYLRLIHSAKPDNTREPISVDVYSVLTAFNVTCPAVQHAVKKLLCAGLRDKGTRVQDLKEAIDALHRAVQMEEQKR